MINSEAVVPVEHTQDPMDLTTAQSYAGADINSDNDVSERAALIARMWSLLPVPLRAEFFLFYHDAENNEELKRRVKIVEDVVFDFLSPLEDGYARAERGFTDAGEDDRLISGRNFSHLEDHLVDWDVIKLEIIERITARDARKMDQSLYHGRGARAAYERLVAQQDTYELGQPSRGLWKLKEPRADCVIDINDEHRHVFIDDLISSSRNRKVWAALRQGHHLDGVGLFDGEVRYRPRGFSGTLTAREDPSGGGTVQEIDECNKRNDAAWSRNRTRSRSLFDWPALELPSYREGVTRTRTSVKKHRASPFQSWPSCPSGGAPIKDGQLHDIGDVFSPLVRWGNFQIAEEVLLKVHPDGYVVDNCFGTPFLAWWLAMIETHLYNGVDDFATIPPSFMLTACTRIPVGCVVSLNLSKVSDSLQTRVISCAGLTPLALALETTSRLHEGEDAISRSLKHFLHETITTLLTCEYPGIKVSGLHLPTFNVQRDEDEDLFHDGIPQDVEIVSSHEESFGSN
eukprot:GHVH01004404.1.p1 GENE.GHVH01004404.1~~GHVH01004404.1.p1  ORF type:complete len:515 (+),score=62.51 GHVH01004404.1:220-1764(+)